MQCRNHAAQLGRLYKTFQEHDTEVLLIGGGTPKDAASLVKTFNLPYPALADPDKAVYLSYGLDKAMLLIQRSALILIDKQGLVRHFHKTANPGDWLNNNDELMEVIAKL